jgi:hypothetical protein
MRPSACLRSRPAGRHFCFSVLIVFSLGPWTTVTMDSSFGLLTADKLHRDQVAVERAETPVWIVSGGGRVTTDEKEPSVLLERSESEKSIRVPKG